MNINNKKTIELSVAIDELAAVIDNGELLAATDPAELLRSATRKIKEQKALVDQINDLIDRINDLLRLRDRIKSHISTIKRTNLTNSEYNNGLIYAYEAVNEQIDAIVKKLEISKDKG